MGAYWHTGPRIFVRRRKREPFRDLPGAFGGGRTDLEIYLFREEEFQ